VKRCMFDLALKPKAVPVNLLSAEADHQISPAFNENVLTKFRSGPTGDVCRSDVLIIQYGDSLYDQIMAKQDKGVEVKK